MYGVRPFMFWPWCGLLQAGMGVHVIAFEGFPNDSAMPLLSGLLTGVNQQTKPSQEAS